MKNNVYILTNRVVRSCNGTVGAAREGRQKALLSISGYCVKVMKDGDSEHQFWSDHPPSLGELAETLGTDSYLVSITRERKPSRLAQPQPALKL